MVVSHAERWQRLRQTSQVQCPHLKSQSADNQIYDSQWPAGDYLCDKNQQLATDQLGLNRCKHNVGWQHQSQLKGVSF